MMKTQRINKELSQIKASPPQGICIYSKNDSLSLLEAQIVGPSETPYENGVFLLEVLIPEKYPFSPPTIKFLTKIYHPNIDDNGRICLDLIKMPPTGSWKPTIGLQGLLIAIRMLLETPNPDDPLMADIAEEFKNNLVEFQKKALHYTQLYASSK